MQDCFDTLDGHPGRPRGLAERFGVIAFSPDVTFELLGQSRWFERMGVKFENFPDCATGRRFGLHHRWWG